VSKFPVDFKVDGVPLTGQDVIRSMVKLHKLVEKAAADNEPVVLAPTDDVINVLVAASLWLEPGE
jgi:NADH:ubiquinone oxidoreductase subunit B-like Fe-S oxidoreductase